MPGIHLGRIKSRVAIMCKPSEFFQPELGMPHYTNMRVLWQNMTLNRQAPPPSLRVLCWIYRGFHAISACIASGQTQGR